MEDDELQRRNLFARELQDTLDSLKPRDLSPESLIKSMVWLLFQQRTTYSLLKKFLINNECTHTRAIYYTPKGNRRFHCCLLLDVEQSEQTAALTDVVVLLLPRSISTQKSFAGSFLPSFPIFPFNPLCSEWLQHECSSSSSRSRE